MKKLTGIFLMITFIALSACAGSNGENKQEIELGETISKEVHRLAELEAETT